MNRHNLKVAKCGAADSKYFSNPEQFDKDIQQNKFETVLFKQRVRQLILEEPNKLKNRYFEVIEVMMEVKKEFGL